jgi:hypothetical protein
VKTVLGVVLIRGLRTVYSRQVKGWLEETKIARPADGLRNWSINRNSGRSAYGSMQVDAGWWQWPTRRGPLGEGGRARRVEPCKIGGPVGGGFPGKGRA